MVAKDGVSWAGTAYIQYSWDLNQHPELSAGPTECNQQRSPGLQGTQVPGQGHSAGLGIPAKAGNAMANHFHGPAEDGLDLICETALQALFIQHAKL